MLCVQWKSTDRTLPLPLELSRRVKWTSLSANPDPFLGEEGLCPWSGFSLRINQNKPELSLKVQAKHTSNILTFCELTGQRMLHPADGMVHWGKRRSLPLSPVEFSLATADCLAVAFVLQMQDEFFVSLVHAGWRGFTQGIHLNALSFLKMAQQDWEKWDWASLLNQLHVYIGPAIFGTHYPCRDDVFESLKSHLERVLALAPQSNCLTSYGHVLKVRCDSLSQKWDLPTVFYPDFQSLMVLDLLAIGVPFSNITLFRENTYGHPFLPSFRGGAVGGTGQDPKQRFWTTVSIT